MNYFFVYTQDDVFVGGSPVQGGAEDAAESHASFTYGIGSLLWSGNVGKPRGEEFPSYHIVHREVAVHGSISGDVDSMLR